ncbi:hypothetical protein [Moellerella wisconsensis]|uniref:hypothetical protein n=1 Tax=Moellerella wisconsensis TaxID=158849 RepID=UPI000640C59B|nr:hypothetical protein [Moellerella wisconsensis]KLN96165.1 hypothetical protein VK86_11360 [Moellerella wisconsensis]
MSAYATKDAQEDRRLDVAAWQDAIDAEYSQRALDVVERIPERITKQWTDEAYDEVMDALRLSLKEHDAHRQRYSL